MERKQAMDLVGAVGMVILASLLAFNQVAIKFTNVGFSPVFAAGLRSAMALVVLGLWLLISGRRIHGLRATIWPGLMLGGLFSLEFLFLFTSLDLTSVSRASITFYSMPVWLAGIAHFALPGERLSARRALGLVLAMAGVALALSDPHSRGDGNIWGDVLALLAALSWAGIALIVRLTRVSELIAEGQLFWQLTISAVVLCAVGPLFGPLLRDTDLLSVLALLFGVIVASAGYLFWLRWMSIYPASDIASFSFLSPVLAVVFGWLILDEPVGVGFLGALALVAAGIVLINRRRRQRD
jgi:drug/metabolite transporter (DMT)-like permease